MTLDLQPANILVSEELRNFVKEPTPGQPPLLFNLLDENGRPFGIGEDYASGGFLILVFAADISDPNTASELSE